MHLSKQYNIRGSNKRKISIFLLLLKQIKGSISTVPIEMETNASRNLAFLLFFGEWFFYRYFIFRRSRSMKRTGVVSSYLEWENLFFIFFLLLLRPPWNNKIVISSASYDVSHVSQLVCRVFEVSFICLRNASERKKICWNDDNKISRIAIKSKHLCLARSANTRDKNQTSICFSSRNCRSGWWIRNDDNKTILRSLKFNRTWKKC